MAERPRKWKGNLIKLAVVAVGLFIVLRWFEHAQVYHPDRSMDAKPGDLQRPFEDVVLKTGDGLEINGWYFPAATNSPRAGRVFLVCHGNAGNISHRLHLCSALLSTGGGVFVFDYRGYGRSQGSPSEKGTARDAEAAYQWLRQKGCAATNIIAYGESLGGGVAAELAARQPLGGLILQSTFTSVPDIGAELFPWLPVKTIASIHYATKDKLPKLKIPVLVMHSPEDDIIPYHHGKTNFALANEPKLFCELSGGHNNSIEDRVRFVAGIDAFLRMVESGGKK